ncbi:MAG: M20/M25/M40 family metallo-hydrolase [Treponema sp.]|jgi:carboxypeptidase PM20D1|nr:M20/M25/M40 family metallo-hydrolase [Treponema sp.]
MDFVEKFRESLKIPTWWPPETQGSAAVEAAEATLLRFQKFLAENFPAFHQAAEHWMLSPYSMVYHWPGIGGTGSEANAVLLLAHYDVVPAETEKWSVDPFGAEMKDGFIYSRGSLDMKSTLISIMEAAEILCAEGRKPKRDIWFAFGGDEERTGILGAMETVKWFENRGQKFDWILDEGTPIAENQIKGIDSPLALISIEEKGYVSLSLTVAQEPGHASRPPRVQAAAILGRALCRIAKKPFPFRLSPTVEMFFKQVSPLMPGVQGFVMRHARAFGPLFFKVAATTPMTASMLRTTAAMTQLAGSAADNVMPSEVRAIINIRLLWPWTVEKASAFIKKAVNDKRVRISVHGLGTNPVPPSRDYRNRGWSEFQAALDKSWPGVPLLPFIMVATTDSRHYQKLSDCIFRFSPHKLDPKELSGIHGHDERISAENLHAGMTFYTELLRSL